MAAGRVLWILGIVLLKFNDSQTLQNVTAKVGQSCVLWSRGPADKQVMVLRCCRLERYSPFVFFYRDERVTTDGQDPSFSKRVELGDFSLVIINVTFEDRGTYECLFQTSDEWREVSRISLMVLPGEEMAGEHEEEPPTGTGDTVWGGDVLIPSVCVVLALSVLGVIGLHKYHTSAKANQREKSNRPSAEELLPSSELA